MDNELVRIWQLIHELGEQLALNQKLTATLQSQTSSLKDEAVSTSTGFSLRRVNLDLSQEYFQSEAERMSAQLVIENQALLHENRQLGVLLKEYESTMETIMSKFRNHSLAAQQHELTLTRHYETLLSARENQTSSTDQTIASNRNRAINRLSHYLRGLLRSLAGEETYFHHPDTEYDEDAPVDTEELFSLLQSLDSRLNYNSENQRCDWAVERECEIERLEKENEVLRRLLGIDPDSIEASGVVMEFAQIRAGRHVPLLRNRMRRESGTFGNPDPHLGPERDTWDLRPFITADPPQNQSVNLQHPQSYAQALQQSPQQQQQLFQQQQQNQSVGVPLQRAVELQPPGMRMNMQQRRIGIFGSQRGSPGRGAFWNNQTPLPSLPAPPLLDRPSPS
jgi:hypothetical protein